MVADILSELNSSELMEFKKDFKELIRVTIGIEAEYGRLSKDIDKYIPKFKKAIGIFNKKYNNVSLRLEKNAEKIRLRILIKEEGVKGVFSKVASKLNGLKSIGADNFGDAPVEDANKFSMELEKIKVVAKVGIKKKKGFLYFIDKKGDISCAKMARGR